MKQLPYQPSMYEQQLAMAILAHATRRDDYALAESLNLLAEPPSGLRPTCVVAALLVEFQRGMDTTNSMAVAQRFSDLAVALAADGPAR